MEVKLASFLTLGVVTFLFTVPCLVNGESILFFHSIATSSHRTSIFPLAQELAERGHNVTYIFPLNKKVGSHPKVEEIVPSKMVDILTEFIGDFDINFRLNDTVNQFYVKSFSKAMEVCEAFYESPEVKDWLARPGLHYDIIFIDNSLGECGYGLVHRFRSKHILFGPAFAPMAYDILGIVPETSSIPSIIGSYSNVKDMTFMDRVQATLTPLLFRIGYVDYAKKLDVFFRDRLNISDIPSVFELEKQTSLYFVNNYFVEDYPISLPPMVISYSGLWCSKKTKKAPKPLPEKLTKFIGNDHFIYVSLGSAVVASTMPIQIRDQFINAFAAFPNFKFLWRWTGPAPENAPKNVLFDKWFPQHDVLSHPKIKGFITQSGRPSTQEALCNEVPFICIPIFGDQEYNADKFESLGATIKLDIMTLTSEKLVDGIKELTETDKYSKRIKELSKIFQDRPIDPLDNAVYWAEYAMRYDTSLLRPTGIHQTWWQRRLLDVYAFFLVILLTISGVLMFLSYKILKVMYNICIKSGGTSKHKRD